MASNGQTGGQALAVTALSDPAAADSMWLLGTYNVACLS